MVGEKPEVAIRLGLDLGGTKIEIIALDKEHPGTAPLSCQDPAGRLPNHTD